MTLELDLDHKLELSAQDFIGTSVAVLGSPGMGKSNTSALLMEQLRPHFPFHILDTHNE